MALNVCVCVQVRCRFFKQADCINRFLRMQIRTSGEFSSKANTSFRGGIFLTTVTGDELVNFFLHVCADTVNCQFFSFFKNVL